MDDVKESVKIKKVVGPPIPEDYIFRRGRIDTVDKDFSDQATEPPAGYLNLNIYSQEHIPHFKNMNPTDFGRTDIIQRMDHYPWPVKDDSVLKINIGANICQLANLELFMRECWRVMVDGGILRIKAPYYTSQNYIANMRNILPICDTTFSYFDISWLKKNQVGYNPQCDFDLVQRLFYYDDYWQMFGDQAKEFARKHYNNVVTVIELVYKPVKPMRKFNDD